ncbi:MAG: SDR family oxidoreductase [Clostridia bacterium]|nr:SDR family oxidoreductase [Clostridia bacterium]
MKLKDKVVIVTASTRGIGLAVTEACAKEGAVVYMAARNLERAEAEAARLNNAGGKVRCVYNDASAPESYISMAETVAKAEGRIDVLVNNFGTSDPKRDRDLDGTDAEVFIDTVTLNLRSVFMASKAVLGYMKNGGSIINISSVGGSVPDISQIAYGTSKAAINYLTKLIAVHEAKNQIRCNAVLPGMTATDAVKQNLSDNFRTLFLKHIPLGRIGLPEEIASAVLYFASDDSAYTTGQILTVSGGFGLATPVYGDLKDTLNRR